MTDATTIEAQSVAGELLERLEVAEARVLRAAETVHSARDAVNGCFASLELENRIKALAASAQALHLAVSEMKGARSALMAIEQEG